MWNDDRLEALYTVALGLGLRRGEALGLNWDDVGVDGRAVHVQEPAQHRPAQELWREVPLVFTSVVGTALEPPNVTRWFPKHIEDAGLPQQRFNDPRHAAAVANIYAHVLPRLKRDAADRTPCPIVRGQSEPGLLPSCAWQTAKGPEMGDIQVQMCGRGGRTRTRDIRFWRSALYQLSYAPVFNCGQRVYLVSRCSLCCLQRGQNFCSASRSGSFRLFFSEW
jgi:hypothetical protein